MASSTAATSSSSSYGRLQQPQQHDFNNKVQRRALSCSAMNRLQQQKQQRQQFISKESNSMCKRRVRVKAKDKQKLQVACRGYSGKPPKHTPQLKTPVDYGLMSKEEAQRNMQESLEMGFDGNNVMQDNEELRDLIFDDMQEPDPDEPLKVGFMLKFVWTEKFLGVTLDQATSKGATPMCPYYFWPREDAWEQMSQMMGSKMWIPELDKVEVLNR